MVIIEREIVLSQGLPHLSLEVPESIFSELQSHLYIFNRNEITNMIIISSGKNSIKIEGHITRIHNIGNGEGYIFIKRVWNHVCRGLISPHVEIKIGDYVKFFNVKERACDPEYAEYGAFYSFGSYQIIEPPNLKPNIQIHQHPEHNSLHSFLKKIGDYEVDYEFHNPRFASISKHVRQQLKDRVLNQDEIRKDFFFLTAFLDRITNDRYVQKTRNENPNFKDDLIECWEESGELLSKATNDIKGSLNILRTGKFETGSPKVDDLYYKIGTRFKFNQLLVCLKIIDEKFGRSRGLHITDLVKSFKEERNLRDYLINIHGVGYKLANWALTNVTGHWFVIDKRIKKVIEDELKKTVPSETKIQFETADVIFKYWFGSFFESQKDYTKLNKSQFKDIFPDYEEDECEYLPFILTQYLWFYEN